MNSPASKASALKRRRNGFTRTRNTFHSDRYGLFVVADAATKIARLGDKGDLGGRRLISSRPGKHVAHCGDLAFGLLCRSVEFWAKHFASGILQRPAIGASQLLYAGNELAVAKVEAEWVQIAILESVIAFVEHRQG